MGDLFEYLYLLRLSLVVGFPVLTGGHCVLVDYDFQVRHLAVQSFLHLFLLLLLGVFCSVDVICLQI